MQDRQIDLFQGHAYKASSSTGDYREMNDLNLKNGSKLEKIRISKISQTRQN
jgi:hypothetical protein